MDISHIYIYIYIHIYILIYIYTFICIMYNEVFSSMYIDNLDYKMYM